MQNSILKRLWDKTEVSEDGCWKYEGISGRYGKIKIGEKYTTTHRVSWNVHNGEIPQDKNVLHTCDVKRCWNPQHLYLGTQSDNMKDCWNRNPFRLKKRRVKIERI